MKPEQVIHMVLAGTHKTFHKAKQNLREVGMGNTEDGEVHHEKLQV